MSERNAVDKCEWEWDGKKWIQLSGPSGCLAPLPPRDPPGTRYTTDCIEEDACCTPELSCCSDKVELITLK